MFICGGAFDGIEKIIEQRLDKKSVGFGAEIKSAKQRNVGETLQHVQQHDLLRFSIIPELIGRLPNITPLNSLGREDLIRTFPWSLHNPTLPGQRHRSYRRGRNRPQPP